MGLNHALATLDGRGQRAALRDGVLESGRRIGWATRTTIVFTERFVRRPWKRCTGGDLSAVLEELQSILRAYEIRRHTLAPRCAARMDRHRRARWTRRNGYAARR
jgi:hypothetical protein